MAMPQGAWANDLCREYLKQLLSHNVMRVIFEKRDGTERTLICTRQMDLIPEEHHPKGVKKDDPAVLPVWSVEDEGWRSFRFDTVRHVGEVKMEDGKIVDEKSIAQGVTG